jgi:hypothetical protein
VDYPETNRRTPKVVRERGSNFFTILAASPNFSKMAWCSRSSIDPLELRVVVAGFDREADVGRASDRLAIADYGSARRWT